MLELGSEFKKVIFEETDWVDLNLTPNWNKFGVDFNAPSYKKINNTICLKGLLSRNSNLITGEVISVLPENFRPMKRLLIGVMCGNMIQRIDIHPNGEIKTPAAVQEVTMLSFEGVYFQID